MKTILRICIALVLMAAGVGVVRPLAVERSALAWEPVARGLTVVPFTDGELIALDEAGEYVVFFEGPALHAYWENGGSSWVELFDLSTGQPLRMSQSDAHHVYDYDGRQARALGTVTLPRPGTFEIDARHSGSATADLGSGGFRMGMARSGLVHAQSLRAKAWSVASIASVVVAALAAVFLLTNRAKD